MAIKQKCQLKNQTNQTMVFSYCSSCLDLPMSLVYCRVEGFPLRLHHICEGGYVILYDIYFEGGERNICCSCVDELGEGVK